MPYQVRADFNDKHGSADFDYLFGSGPVAFENEESAKKKVAELENAVPSCDWGEADPPSYHYDEISQEEYESLLPEMRESNGHA